MERYVITVDDLDVGVIETEYLSGIVLEILREKFCRKFGLMSFGKMGVDIKRTPG